ncbi:DUF7837 family putative zinc-binding protein [Halorientalis pallida]|uniref:DUF7837 family putative zinc-binding protein n=1 Tax=Halorientalis pallida TaxID=2479928 RepID=UPI00187D2F99|nr:hypothetical protein [Halorientalis pallida]
MSRTATHESLGSCPRCGTSIPSRNLLIRYERADGEARYAACPDCETPVRPA